MENKGKVSSIYPVFTKSWFYEVLLKNKVSHTKKQVHILKCQLMDAENEKFKTLLFGTPDKMDLINGY